MSELNEKLIQAYKQRGDDLERMLVDVLRNYRALYETVYGKRRA